MDSNSLEREIKEIGRSSRSVVNLVEKLGVKMARKEIDVSRLSSDEVGSIKKEIELLSFLRDRCVVIYKESRYDKIHNKYYIYTEYFENGDLFHLIQEHISNQQYFDEKTIRVYTEDVARSLRYIHSKGVVHRDLKPANIFIGNHNELIIGDFGIAVKSGVKEEKLAGTIGYMAPELWTNNPPIYTPATDIFSFGCILYEIYTLRRLFDGGSDEKTRDLILNPNYQILFNRNPSFPIVEHLIKRMLERNPIKRISLDEIFTSIEQWKNGINVCLSSSIENIGSIGETILIPSPPPPPPPPLIQQPYQPPLPSEVSSQPPPPLYKQQYPIQQQQIQPQIIQQQNQQQQIQQQQIQQQQIQQQPMQQQPKTANKFINISMRKNSPSNQIINTQYYKPNIQQQQNQQGQQSIPQPIQFNNEILFTFNPPQQNPTFHTPKQLNSSSVSPPQSPKPQSSQSQQPQQQQQKENKFIKISNFMKSCENSRTISHPNPSSPHLSKS